MNDDDFFMPLPRNCDLPQVDLTRWKWRDPKITYQRNGSDLVILLTATVRSVETGEEGPLVQQAFVSRYGTLAEQQTEIRTRIVHMIKSMLMHELDECLYIDGERVCAEPHPEKQFKLTGI